MRVRCPSDTRCAPSPQQEDEEERIRQQHEALRAQLALGWIHIQLPGEPDAISGAGGSPPSTDTTDGSTDGTTTDGGTTDGGSTDGSGAGGGDDGGLIDDDLSNAVSESLGAVGGGGAVPDLNQLFEAD
jgi:hypothetical protein